MKYPVVSVIMNCLNAGKDLIDSLESVKEQTFQDLEIIFWDNGSTDSSPQIAQSYGPKLRYFRSKETVSLGAARNLAIAQAKGKYIAFLDCDDLWLPTKLQKQVNLLDSNPKIGLVCTDTAVFDGKDILSRVFEQSIPERGNVFDALMIKQWISMSSAILRRNALDAVKQNDSQCWFDESLHVCEEADVFYRIAHDWQIDYIDEPLTLWRVHSSSSTFKKFDQFSRETLYILDKHRKLYANYEQEHPAVVEALTKRAAFQKAIALWREGRNSESREIIKPYLTESKKYRLFWFASFLPGSFFDFCSRLYFFLPAKFRH